MKRFVFLCLFAAAAGMTACSESITAVEEEPAVLPPFANREVSAIVGQTACNSLNFYAPRGISPDVYAWSSNPTIEVLPVQSNSTSDWSLPKTSWNVTVCVRGTKGPESGDIEATLRVPGHQVSKSRFHFSVSWP